MILSKPFTGRELFVFYSLYYGGNTEEISLREWEEKIGKNKKSAWNKMADIINEHMQQEINNAHLANP